MSENITKVKAQDCCGCGACYNKCPVGAISMQENEEGFLAPVIDESKCTNCGLCVKSCPSLNVQYNNTDKPECYAAMADDEIRMKSSSGGIFTLLAEYILDKGGYVCGAAFDDNWDVHHIIIDDKNDLDKLRGSKYVQSNTENCYKQIKKLLDEDKYVLFSGCPCQVAGLYAFLGKNYEKLYTVDILCHGSPSPGVWQKYLTETFDKNDIEKINFRDKNKIGWSCSHCIISMRNGEDIVTDDYTKLFHLSINLRKSCYDCNYSKKPRPADITLGDFWGISDHIKGLNDGKGLSFVLINNDKGKFFFNEIADKTKKWDINLLKDYNNGHQKYGLQMHPQREQFFRLMKKYRYNQAKNIILYNKYDVCYVSIFYGRNYGSVMVSYAGLKIIESLGYSVLSLQKPSFMWQSEPIKDSISTNFAEKHYEISDVFNSYTELTRLNDYCSTFVVGSDQQFSPILKFNISFLSYAHTYKNKIAFGTSFGRDDFTDIPEQKIKKQFYLNRFNHIALREVSDKLCNELYNLNNAIEIIDPTLILPKKEYTKLLENIDLGIKQPYLLTYLLDVNAQKLDVVNYIATKLNLTIINIPNLDPRQKQRNKGISYYKEDVTPEEFLYLYENASFIVTDSFHGTCFSIKFNKNFVSLKNSVRGGLRYKLFENLGLKNRIVSDYNLIYNNNFYIEPIDYIPINIKINEKANFAINWLKNALENNNSSEKFSDYENYMDLKIKELSCKIAAIPEPPEPVIINNYNNDAIEHKYLLLGNKNHINKKYYRYKWLAKIMLGKKRKHYKEKARIFHEKVREIRRLEKEACQTISI